MTHNDTEHHPPGEKSTSDTTPTKVTLAKVLPQKRGIKNGRTCQNNDVDNVHSNILSSAEAVVTTTPPPMKLRRRSSGAAPSATKNSVKQQQQQQQQQQQVAETEKVEEKETRQDIQDAL